jgi:hypothetical protein
MAYLAVTVIEYVDNSQPGWVRAIFKDINGKEWSIVDKTVYLEGYESLDADTIYPQPDWIDCQIISERFDSVKGRIFTIDISIAFALETEDGQTRFEVFSDQIKEEL